MVGFCLYLQRQLQEAWGNAGMTWPIGCRMLKLTTIQCKPSQLSLELNPWHGGGSWQMVMLVAYLSSFGHVPWPICCNKLTTDRTNRVTSTNPLETPMYIQIGQDSKSICMAYWKTTNQSEFVVRNAVFSITATGIASTTCVVLALFWAWELRETGVSVFVVSIGSFSSPAQRSHNAQALGCHITGAMVQVEIGTLTLVSWRLVGEKVDSFLLIRQDFIQHPLCPHCRSVSKEGFWSR